MSLSPALSSSEFRQLNALIAVFQSEMALYGYQMIETPVIDSADLFLTRAGDQLVSQLLTFERQGKQLALRPEFTAAAAHRYAQLSASCVVRWQFSGPIFENRADQPYQKPSMGAELIGMNSPVADAEIISLAANGITKIGITDWQLTIGHTGLLKRLLADFRLDSRTERFLLSHIATLQNHDQGKTYILETFDRTLLGSLATAAEITPVDMAAGTETNAHQMLNVLLDATQRGMTMGGRTRHDIARRLLQKRQRFTERQQVIAAIDFLARWVAISGPPSDSFEALADIVPADNAEAAKLLIDWQSAIDLLSGYAVDLNQIIIQPYVARHWDYYTGIVFEISSNNHKRLAGGGRYDELVSLIGGKAAPSVGLAYYLDQILDCSPSTPESEVRPVIITVTDTNGAQATRLARQLRDSNIPTILLHTNDVDTRAAIVITVDHYGEIEMNQTIYQSDEIAILIGDILQQAVYD